MLEGKGSENELLQSMECRSLKEVRAMSATVRCTD